MHHISMVSNEQLSGINPIQFGYAKCAPRHSWGPGIRTYWLIHFVVSGKGIFRSDGKLYSIGAGEMFVIRPYKEIYYEADADDPWEYIWIGFTAGGSLPVKLENVIRCPEAEEIFRGMQSCEALSKGRSIYLAARVWDVFALLSEGERESEDVIRYAMDCMQSEYMNGITVEEVASRVHLDRTYFSAMFKKRVGVSPKKYLQDHRMTVAASLIADKGMPISVAAYSVGYSDIFTFSKMFKRYYGMSPTDYVKMKKEGKE